MVMISNIQPHLLSKSAVARAKRLSIRCSTDFFNVNVLNFLRDACIRFRVVQGRCWWQSMCLHVNNRA